MIRPTWWMYFLSWLQIVLTCLDNLWGMFVFIAFPLPCLLEKFNIPMHQLSKRATCPQRAFWHYKGDFHHSSKSSNETNGSHKYHSVRFFEATEHTRPISGEVHAHASMAGFKGTSGGNTGPWHDFTREQKWVSLANVPIHAREWAMPWSVATSLRATDLWSNSSLRSLHHVDNS